MKQAAFLKLSIVAIILSVFASRSVAISEASKQAIAERIKPTGEICLEGDSSCANSVAVAGGAQQSGEEIYQANCVACHSTGAAGAPKLGDTAAWSDRLAAGIDSVYANAIQGINGMPAKGLCMSCSDDDIKATVDYMLDSSQ